MISVDEASQTMTVARRAYDEHQTLTDKQIASLGQILVEAFPWDENNVELYQ
jgi:hypothetical protein